MIRSNQAYHLLDAAVHGVCGTLALGLALSRDTEYTTRRVQVPNIQGLWSKNRSGMVLGTRDLKSWDLDALDNPESSRGHGKLGEGCRAPCQRSFSHNDASIHVPAAHVQFPSECRSNTLRLHGTSSSLTLLQACGSKLPTDAEPRLAVAPPATLAERALDFAPITSWICVWVATVLGCVPKVSP